MPKERRGRGPRNLIKVGGQNGATYVGHTHSASLMKVIIQTIPSESYRARRGQNEIKGETDHRGLEQLEGGKACSLALVETL